MPSRNTAAPRTKAVRGAAPGGERTLRLTPARESRPDAVDAMDAGLVATFELLQGWNLTRAMDTPSASELIQELDELWISDVIWAPPRRVSNVAVLPEGLRGKTVVGWERTPG